MFSSNVFEYYNCYDLSVSTQAVSGPKDDKRERVLWVRFESCDINDASLGDSGRGNPLLLILGLANGFAVWTITVGEVTD